MSDTSPETATGRPQVLDFFQFAKILRQYKWLILGFTLLCTSAAYYFGMQRTPTYTAAASMIVDPSQNQLVGTEALVSTRETDEFTVATQMNLLSSRRHIERVMNSLDLFNDREFAAGPDTGGSYVTPEVNATVTDHSSQDSAIQRFTDRFEVRQQGKSYVVSVRFTSTEPVKAAKIANHIATLYVENARTNKLEATDEASGWLEGRVEALREEVNQAENAVEQFRAANDLFYSREGSANLDEAELLAQNTELVRLRTEIASNSELMTLIAAKRDRSENLDELPEIGSSPTIVRLKQDESALVQREVEMSATYGKRHPTMIAISGEREKIQAKIDAETNRIVEALNNTLQLMLIHKQTIEEKIAALHDKGMQEGQLEIKLRELEREAEANRKLYDTYLQRFKETSEQQALVQSDVRIVSMAAPPSRPSSPGPEVFGVVGFTASLLASTLAALLASKLDKGVRDPNLIKEQLGLSMVCSVPALDLKTSPLPHRYLIEKPLSAYTEALRSAYLAIRDNLGVGGAHSSEEQEGKVVLVTSSLPSEGKSTFAMSLATLIGQQQHKALIIDLDIRHPTIHRNLNSSPPAGIVDFCSNEELDWMDIVHNDRYAKLDVIVGYGPVEQTCPNPVTMLESERLKEMFANLREYYDLIIIDSPPLLAVSEARMATAYADAAVFVMRWGHVDIDTAKEAIEYLDQAELPIVAAVLTQVNMTKQSKYYGNNVSKHYQKFEKYYTN